MSQSHHLHFTAGLSDVLDKKHKLFSWTCPVSPLDTDLSTVISRSGHSFFFDSYEKNFFLIFLVKILFLKKSPTLRLSCFNFVTG